MRNQEVSGAAVRPTGSSYRRCYRTRLDPAPTRTYDRRDISDWAGAAVTAPPAAQEETAAALIDAVRVEVPECGHILPWEKPDVLRDEVVRFLRVHAPVAA